LTVRFARVASLLTGVAADFIIGLPSCGMRPEPAVSALFCCRDKTNENSGFQPSRRSVLLDARLRGEAIRAHRHCRVTAVVLCWLLAVAAVSAAQSTDEERLSSRPLSFELIQVMPERPVHVLSEQQIEQLEKWTRDFAEWQKWADRWLNRRQPGKWAYSQERKQKPDPPVWLDGECELLADDDRLVHVCELLAEWREDPIAAKNRQAAATSLIQAETPTKSVWWRHLHVDGLWSTARSDVSVLGLFGAHITIPIAGRLQVFAVPGIMVVTIPSVYGNREFSPATDWGLSYRLFAVGRSTVHFNLVHAWMLGNRSNLIDSNITLAGFSVSFRPHPQ
jgi:hypothetical protein